MAVPTSMASGFRRTDVEVASRFRLILRILHICVRPPSPSPWDPAAPEQPGNQRRTTEST